MTHFAEGDSMSAGRFPRVELDPRLVPAAFTELLKTFGVTSPPARVPLPTFLDPPYGEADLHAPCDAGLLEAALALSLGQHDPRADQVRQRLITQFPDEIRYTIVFACRRAGEDPIRLLAARATHDMDLAIVALRRAKHLIANCIELAKGVVGKPQPPVARKLAALECQRRCPGFRAEHYIELISTFHNDISREG